MKQQVTGLGNGAGGGGGRRGKEPEWAMGRTGRGGAQRVHYAPGSHYIV